MIKVRDSVRLKRLSLGLSVILKGLEEFHRIRRDYPDEFTISSINDSTHVNNSKHYIDEAVDVYSLGFTGQNQKESFRYELEDYLNTLGPCRFTVLLESPGVANEHFHIQLKMGTSDGTPTGQ